MTDDDIAELISQMRANGESLWPDRLLDDLADAPLLSEREIDWRDKPAAAPKRELTAFQTRVLECLSRGLTVGETAVLVGRPSKAVSAHARRARMKLRSKTTAQACCEAIRRGLIP